MTKKAATQLHNSRADDWNWRNILPPPSRSFGEMKLAKRGDAFGHAHKLCFHYGFSLNKSDISQNFDKVQL